MKHRDRVLMVLNHEKHGRCPIQVGFKPEFASKLKKELKGGAEMGVDSTRSHNIYELERAVGDDLLLTSVGSANSYYQDRHKYVAEWGIGWRLFEVR